MSVITEATAVVNKTVEPYVAQAKQALVEGRKPLLAYVGAGDLAVEKLRTIPATYATEAKKVQDRVTELQTTATARAKALPETVKGYRGTVEALPETLKGLRGTVEALPETLKGLRGTVEALPETLKGYRGTVEALPETVKGLRGTVEAKVTELSGKATALYAELTTRGEAVVTTIRKQPKAAPAKPAAKPAAKKTATAAKKAVKPAAKAVKATVETVETAAADTAASIG